MRKSFIIRPTRFRLFVGLIFCLLGFSLINLHPKIYLDNLKSITRPIWDTAEKPFQTLNHFYHPELEWPELCRLNFNSTLNTKQVKVYDAILLSFEVDLLEIRLRELFDVVDKFLIIESNMTFTGISKEYNFDINSERFGFAKDKIIYQRLKIDPQLMEKGPWGVERIHRGYMTRMLRQHNISAGDWVIMSDLDEIPSWHTIKLIRTCDNVPPALHLQFREFMYSFEFETGAEYSKAKIVKMPHIYGHDRISDIRLADSGWHCSFCFKFIHEFRSKMTGYSHADRVHSSKLLETNEIQKSICAGTNLFGMLPEAYSYGELIRNWKSFQRNYNFGDLPKALLLESSKFRFLLPGGCKREN